MSTYTTFTFPGSDGTPITAYRWDPQAAPKAILQITHGVGEHALRYTEPAERFAAEGFVVYAQDHRGHGATAGSPEQFGQIGTDGWYALVADIGALSAVARRENPGLRLTLLSHSLGSFATQQYLIDHSGDVDGVILTGTAAIDLLAPALDLDNPVGLDLFNAAFQPARTDFDWLSRDESMVDAYLADPRTGFNLDQDGLKAMFDGAAKAATATDQVRSDLPLYIAVGAMDPVNGGLALLTALEQRYRDAGLTNLTVVTYPEARHEILNETNRDEVLDAMVDWVHAQKLG
ncbi:alpha/beta fold hydrolase [Labedaea rhizosphaerae]|uniref:Alpha-beta hydrolase superfamily lysophospholipase n=1 Tax=Labedaea rhizosphaerae TaxID=598644 RepID=A0A4R6RY93_LABRH|nr:alpha/beta hydrolase [Labedaea rhizosphaerae]TDP91903.1 alpha-beta hydrolase superfamily lysophospholipase [Labedaea rhizosphaerae]